MMNSKIEVLSPEAMDRVHEASMEILAKKGVIFESEKARDLLKKAGRDCFLSKGSGRGFC